jgi:hypothetical protein
VWETMLGNMRESMPAVARRLAGGGATE